MKTSHWFGVLVLSVALAVSGCKKDTPDKAKGQANPDAAVPDKQAQVLCPISSERLGSMGVPIKVEVQGRPVFLCCKACQKSALADPAKTLAKLEKLKTKTP